VTDERERLLALTAEYLLEHGVIDLRLRTLGDAIGSSHRVLLYYFESRERLITEALDAAARTASVRDATLLGPRGDDPDVAAELVRVWKLIRLFFQVVAAAIHDATKYGVFLDSLHTEWSGAYRGYLHSHGVPTEAAAELAGEIIGLQRGLQFELAVGGSARSLDRSFAAAAQRWAERVAEFSHAG
jgi:AcrR family transcriptional regulator